MKSQLVLSVLICILLLTAFTPAPKSIASPLPPIAGILTVNTAADVITSDSFLSLREAMEVAAGTLTGPFTAGEQTQLAGCLFDFLGIIYSGCGAGLDKIVFAPNLTEIVLTSRLPQIIKDNVVIDGSVSAGNIIINANAVVDMGMQIEANYVILENLTIVNVTGFGSAIIMGAYKGMQVYNNYLGVFPDTFECSDFNITSRTPMIINATGSGTAATGDGSAYIDNNVIGCSLHDGIDLQLAPYVYIGQNILGGSIGNWIGVSRSGRDYSNMGNGIGLCCTPDTTGTQITNNRIAYNDLNGIILAAVTNTTINNNDIYLNNSSGIRIMDSDLTTLNNNKSHDNGGFGIWLMQINPSPLSTTANKITGGSYYRNSNAGIGEGGGAGNNTWSQVSTFDNGELGIDTNGNFTPDPPAITLTGTTPSTPGVLVHGTLDVPLVLMFYTYHIELYLVSQDPTGYGEGKQYIGSTDVVWNLANDYTWTIPNPLGVGCYTATLTIRPDFTPSDTYSSEFNANLGTQCQLTFVPLLLK
jgi:hypothetical protein